MNIIKCSEGIKIANLGLITCCKQSNHTGSHEIWIYIENGESHLYTWYSEGNLVDFKSVGRN